MAEKLSYITFTTDMGWVGVLGSAKGLRRTILPQRSDQEARRLLGSSPNHAVWSTLFFEDLVQRLTAYFGGHKTAFPDELDLSGATSFQREVWAATRLIPYGETKSYTWVAEQIKQPRAVRAVGQALGRNPLPVIIPCHRVVASDGKLGGYSGGLGVKRHLLNLETAASAE